MKGTVAAVDLGATSGRVIVASVDADGVKMSVAHRFPNTPIETSDGLWWDIDGLFANVRTGLRQGLTSSPDLASVAVDSWAIDYGLLRGDRLTGRPHHYRDPRSAGGVEAVHAVVSPADLYARNGLQFLPFNTLYQLAAEPPDALGAADRLLLIPDLIGLWLTGVAVTEATNASTTGLLNVTDRRWDDELIGRLGLPRDIFGDVVDPGTIVGPLAVEGLMPSGAKPPVLTTVGSHDTASAVVGVPMVDAGAAYISCGTWGLVGVELEAPVLTESARHANFTNEGGVDGRTRFLRNVMGLWLLSESLREWERQGARPDLAALLGQAAALPASPALFDVDDERFLPPGDIPGRIRDWYAERGLAPPASSAAVVRAVVDSLADAFARTVAEAAALSGSDVRVVHLVGGGALNELLCQETANALGRPLVAGPVEATALGNVLVQARSAGYVSGSLEALRALAARSEPVVRYEPRRRKDS